MTDDEDEDSEKASKRERIKLELETVRARSAAFEVRVYPEALRGARAACKEGDYPAALERYDRFFEEWREDGPDFQFPLARYLGLAGWARLARKYPPALERLTEKKNIVLERLEQSREPLWFREFNSICRSLDCVDEPIKQFLSYHASDRELASTIVPIVWDRLIEAKQWAVCGAYVSDPMAWYQKFLGSLDGPNYEEFYGWALGNFVRNVGNLILVLRNNDRDEDAALVEQRVAADAETRGHPEIVALVQERIAGTSFSEK